MYWTNRACSKEMKRRERAESHPGTQLEWSIICLISFILRQVCVCVCVCIHNLDSIDFYKRYRYSMVTCIQLVNRSDRYSLNEQKEQHTFTSRNIYAPRCMICTKQNSTYGGKYELLPDRAREVLRHRDSCVNKTLSRLLGSNECSWC